MNRLDKHLNSPYSLLRSVHILVASLRSGLGREKIELRAFVRRREVPAKLKKAMKKVLFVVIIAILPLGFALATGPGCSDSCEELAEVCADCPNDTYRASCNQLVARDSQSLCSQELGTFVYYCPEIDAGTTDGGTSTCPSGQSLCGTSCVNLATDSQNCGSCSNACGTGKVCALGTCSSSCPESLTNCSGSCVNLAADAKNCGTCGTTCPSDKPLCSDGKSGKQCVATCDSSSMFPTKCDTACVNLSNDPLNCGKCGTACESGQVCSAGTCEDSCGDGLTKCCGVCVNTQTNPRHCGSCTTSLCSSSGSGGSGTGGSSSGGSGAGGGSGTAGGSASSTTNCEAASQVCLKGVCATSCDPFTNCGGACVDTTTDAFNCGECAKTCATTEVCASGACSGSCASNETDCSGACVNTQTNQQNCGSCATVCADSGMCLDGLCSANCGDAAVECPDGSGNCINMQTDPSNCGTCGTDCTDAGKLCSSGSCVSSCGSGETNCNGGCVDLTKDMNNCGSCGTTCNDNNVCTKDSCKSDAGCENTSLSGSACDDGDKCTVDTCDSKKGCQSTALTTAEIEALCGSSSASSCSYCAADAGCRSATITTGCVCTSSGLNCNTGGSGAGGSGSGGSGGT